MQRRTPRQRRRIHRPRNRAARRIFARCARAGAIAPDFVAMKVRLNAIDRRRDIIDGDAIGSAREPISTPSSGGRLDQSSRSQLQQHLCQRATTQVVKVGKVICRKLALVGRGGEKDHDVKGRFGRAVDSHNYDLLFRNYALSILKGCLADTRLAQSGA
nr:hypothetical protein [Sphingopyxis sp. EG6]